MAGQIGQVEGLTSEATERGTAYFVTGSSTDYGWKLTGNSPAILWTKAEYQVLENCVSIRFDDMSVAIDEDGLVRTQFGVDESIWNDDEDMPDDSDGVEPSSMPKSETGRTLIDVRDFYEGAVGTPTVSKAWANAGRVEILGDGILAYHGPRDAKMIDEITFVLHDGHWDTQILKVRIEDNQVVTEFGSQLIPNQMDEMGVEVNLDIGSFITEQMMDDQSFIQVTGLPPGLTYNSARMRIEGKISEDVIVGQPYRVSVVIHSSQKQMLTSNFEWMVRDARSSDQRSTAALALPPMNMTDDAAAASVLFSVAASSILVARSFQLDRANVQSSSPTGGSAADRFNLLNVAQSSKADNSIAVGSDGDDLLDLRLNLPSGVGTGDGGETEEKSELADAVLFASGLGGEQIDASSTSPAGSLNLNDAKTDTGSTVTGGQVNKAPFTGSPANAVTLEDVQLDTIDVLASAFDQESDILSIASATVDVGSVTINADQTLSYIPDPDFNGVATITYTLRDTADNFSIGSIGVDVVAVNDAPTGGTLPISPVSEDGAINVNVMTFASDIDGDVLTVVSASAWQGSVVINGDNTLTYNPNPDYNGADTVTYTLSDGNGGTVTNTFSVAISAVNDIPVGASDAGIVLEDGTIVVDVLANDFDIDSALDSTSVQVLGTTSAGDPLVVIGEGVWTVNSTSGEISFTPEANYAGSVTPISYTVNDTNGASSVPISVSVSIAEINDAPVAVSESGVVIEDSVVAINALANDTDLDGVLVPASVQIVGTASAGDPLFVIGEGTWTVSTINGDIMFTPEPNYAGSVTDITYTVRDEDGAVSNAVSVSVSITEINDVPTGLANTGVVVEDASVTIDVLANDTDLDGALVPASVQISGTALAGAPLVVAGQGAWSVNTSNGEITFTPETNYAGAVTDIAYTVSDEDGGISAPIAVSVSITEINDAPVAVLESGTVIEDGSVTLDVLANDTDLDGVLVPASVQIGGTVLAGDPLVVAGQGTWTVNTSNGEITFTPEPNYSGLVTDITYTVRDEDGAVSNAVSVSVSITEINDVPTGLVDSGVVVEDAFVTIDVLANDTDLDGTLVPASVQISGTALAGAPLVVAGQGTWTVNTSNGEITFTPEPNYAGAVTDIAYTVSDEDGGISAPIAVSVSISSVNDLPVAVADTGTGTEEVALVFDVLANDSDLDGVLDPASVFLSGTASAGLPLVVAGEGVWSVNIANGEVTFTPEVNFNGTITPITYTVSDFDGGTSVPVSLSGSLAAVNDAPLANVVPTGATNEDTLLASFDVLSSATDVEGDTLTVTAASAANGVVTINGDGTLNYTPSANYNGTDTITYTVDDGNGGIDTANVSIIVAAVNDAPVAGSPPLRNTLEDTALNSIDVLGFASDIDGDVMSVSASSASNGSVVINGDGTLNYTPSADFNGLDTVSYTVNDGAGGTVGGTFFVFVTSVNDAPVATADSGSVPEDGSITFNIFTNDTDVDGTLVASSVQIGGTASAGDPLVVAGEGVWTVNTITGQISFTPEANYTGPVADITYTVEDNDGAVSSPVTVSVTITNVNDAPVAGTMATISGTEDVAVVSIDVLALATDAEGDTLIVTIASATNGAVVINGDNTLTYTPNADYNGSDTITYTISDGNGGLSVGTVPISLAAVNDAPVAGSVAGQSTAEETTISSIDVLSAAIDVDGDTLSVSVASALNGVVTINGDNTLNYTPNNNYFGSDTITYTVDDGNGGTDVATVSVTISSINDAPILDLSDHEDAISNGSFNAGSVANWTGWTTSGPFMNGGVSPGAPAVNNDNVGQVSTLTQTGVTGLSSGPGSNGTGLVRFDLGWDNHTIDDGKPQQLSFSINGIEYLRVVTPNDDGPPAVVTYLNGASGPNTTILESTYGNWTYYPVEINLPTSIADTGNVVFSWVGLPDWENGIDDISIDNVQIIVDDANPADSDHSVNYQNGDAPVDLLDATASISDLDDTTLQSAQVILIFAESGDQLRVNGTTASNGASGTVNGLSWSSVISGGAITVNISGTGNHADYLTALNQVQFYSSSGSPVASTRVIHTTINDGVDNSAIAITRVVFGVDPDAPNTLADTGSGSEDVALVIDVLANDSDGDAAIDPTSVHIYGTANPGDSFVVAGEGTWSVNAVNGQITFTGEPDFNGAPTPIQYDVADVTGHRSTLTSVTANLAAVNDAPIAIGDSDTTAEDNSVTINVLVNDSDIDGTLNLATIQIVGTSNPGDSLPTAQGVWSVDTILGTITFAPLADFNGVVTPVSYTVDDDLGATSNAVTIAITVTPVNDAPVAVTEIATVIEDSFVAIDVLANDSDVDGTLDPASVQIVGTASAGDPLVVAGEGVWTVNIASGEITFTPEANYTSSVTDISYTVDDDLGATSNPTVVSVSIDPVNDVPILDLSDREDVISNGSFNAGTVANWTNWIASGPFMNSGVASNAPAIQDDTVGLSSTITQLGVTGLSDGPGVNGTALIKFGLGWNNAVGAGEVGKPMQLTLSVNGIDYVRIVTPDGGGSLATTTYLNGASGPTGTISKSVHANWTYSTVEVNLPAAISDTGNVVFTWDGLAGASAAMDDISIDNVEIIVNDANPADGDHAVNYQNGNAPVDLLDATASISDLDGSVLQAAQVVLTVAESGDQLQISGSLASNGASGTVSGLSWSSVISGGAITVDITGSGSHATYLAALNQVQYYSNSGTPVASTRVINLTVDDGTDVSAIATTRVVFGVDPEPPNTVADTGAGSEDVALVINVLANDSDGAATIDPTSVQIYGTVNPGDSLVVSGEGVWSINTVSGDITFTGEANFNGSPTDIQYDVADVSGHRSILTSINATLAPVNDAPVAATETAIVIEDSIVVIDVLANDSDVDGTLVPASVQIVGTASAGDPLVVAGEGTWTVNGANGEITFTPLPNYTGSVADISYTVDDDLGATSNAVSVSISIDPVNDAPVAVTESAPVLEDSSVIFLTLSNDVDVDGTLVPASVQIVGTASAGDPLVVAGEGTWSVNTTNGNITFTPLPDFEGVVTDISYAVQDDSGATSNPAVVSATITPVNDAPTDIAFAGTSIDENSIAGTLVSTLSSTDIDTGDIATYSIASDPSGFFQIVGNELQVAAGAAIDYEVLTSHSVDVTVTDSGGLTHTETVVIGVNNLLDFIPSDIIATGNNGTSMNTDGGNAAYYQTTNGSAVLGGLSQFTVETQFSILDYSGMLDIPLLSYATASASNEMLIQLIDVNSSTPAIVVEFDGVSYETIWDSSPLLDGGQHTLSVSWDNTAGDLVVYADGIAVETISGFAVGNTVASGGELVFALEQDSVLDGYDLNQVFSGTFHDIRIFADIRTPAEIAAGANQTIPGDPNTLANWQFGEAGNITDVVLGNDLILNQFVGAGWTSSTPSAVLGIGEHRPSGTVVADLTTIDADVGDTFTYAITSDPSGSFAISGSQLIVGSSTSLDYDLAQSHDVTIEVTDSSGQTYSEVFTVRVLNEDDSMGYFEGTPNVDSLSVSGLSSYVYAKASDDTVTGGTGNDILHGQDGSDSIDGGDGNDIIFGDRQLHVLDSVDGQVTINTTTTGNQSAPVTVALHDGSMLVVWYDEALTASTGGQVRGQIVQPNGTKVGAELVIGTSIIDTHDGFSTPPLDAVILANGDVLVSWVADNTVNADGDQVAVVASVVDVLANSAGNEFVVNTNSSGQQSSHTSVALNDGRSLVIWNDDGIGSANSYLQGQFLSTSGSLDGGQFIIGSSRVESESLNMHSVSAVLQSDGNVVVNWVTEADDNVDGAGSAVAGVIVNSTSMTAGAETIITTTTATNQSAPSVVALAAGGTMVAWYDDATSDPAGQVRGQFVNADGSLNGSELLIGTSNAQGNANIELPTLGNLELANGNVFVFWSSAQAIAADGSDEAVVGAIIDGATQLVGTEFIINSTTLGGQFVADAVLLNDGRIFVTWKDDTGGTPSDLVVRGQFLQPDGTLDGAELLLGSANIEADNALDAYALTSEVTANGDIFVSWMSNDSLNVDGDGSAVVSVLVRTATTSGDDIIDGGAGDDYISGGEGDDNLEGGTGADTLDGGAGTDTVSYANAAAGVHVLLEAADANGLGGTYFSGVVGGQTGEAAGDAYTSIESFVGTDFDDWLFGTTSGVTANLGQGNDLFDNPVTNTSVDIIDGGAGNDTIYVGDGDDFVTGGAGDDTISGEDGNDTAIYSGNHADYTAVDLTGGFYSITDNRPGSPDGTDTVFGFDFFQFADGTIDLATLLATSPIAIDLNEDGQINVTGETTSREKSNEAEIGSTVEFDMDGDGDLEVIEWLDGSGDGLLVDNRDGNAATDMNGTRLFGDQSGEFEHGYQQLAQLDENADGVVSGDELQGIEIWVDDGDASVQEGELFTLDEMGIVELSVELNDGAQDGEGRNLFQSTATRADGSTLLTEDVWFASQSIDKDDDITKIEPLVPQPLEELMA